jgi:hypothetical protein
VRTGHLLQQFQARRRQWILFHGFVAPTTVVSSPRAFPEALQVAPRSPTDEVTLRIIVVGSADQAQRVVQQLTRYSRLGRCALELHVDAGERTQIRSSLFRNGGVTMRFVLGGSQSGNDAKRSEHALASF